MTVLLDTIRAGGPTLVIIGVLSVLALFVCIERLMATYGLAARVRAVTDHVIKLIYQGDMDQARAYCQQSGEMPAPMFGAALARVAAGREGVDTALDRERLQFNQQLRRRLWILGTIGAAAPFVGLFGTVLGIMRSMGDIADSGGGGFAVVSRGVSEALITTAAGIFVAVEAVVFYNFLQARTGQLAFSVRMACDELVDVLGERQKRGSLQPTGT